MTDFIARLWRGDVGLAVTYWVFGVLAGFVWGFFLAMLNLVPGSMTAKIIVGCWAAYFIFVYVCIWRAATKYKGAKTWATLAKLVVVLVPLVAALSIALAVFKSTTSKNYNKQQIEASSVQSEQSRELSDKEVFGPTTPLTQQQVLDAERPRPKYDFYTLLPEKEVVIPDAELDAQARAEAAKPPVAVAANPNDVATTVTAVTGTSTTGVAPTTAAASGVDGPQYLIQAGAFRGSTEAEALRAQIAQTGEIARVEVAQINGNIVHRVRMGPYPNASALAAAKAALASHGITAQAIKVK